MTPFVFLKLRLQTLTTWFCHILGLFGEPCFTSIFSKTYEILMFLNDFKIQS